MLSNSEENYLKAIYNIEKVLGKVSTNILAEKLESKASSITDMVKKLAKKKLVNYKKYQGVQLTEKGQKIALRVIRKHRLWETFLVNKLEFSWDEVHEIAEQLEHVNSDKLIDQLDDFLGNPKVDPHGDPIPDKKGKINPINRESLISIGVNQAVKFVGVSDSSDEFLRYLDNKEIAIGDNIKIQNIESYDNSYLIEVNEKQHTITFEVAKKLNVTEI